MKKWKKIVGWTAGLLALCLAAVAGGGFYLLSYALRPDAVMAEKNAASYKYMYEEYPFLSGWLDSLRRTGALRDTVITGAEGERLHAIYAAAPRPTDRTAVIVHGYTDNAIRMLMIGYLYNRDLGCNILLPDLHYHGQSEGRAIRMGWRDRLDVLRWIGVADGIFGGDTRTVVHGISMGAATTIKVSGEEQHALCEVLRRGLRLYERLGPVREGTPRAKFSLPTFPLLHVASWLCELRYGWNFREASALDQVARCDRPMLFIHGDADDYVPTWMVYPFTGRSPATRSCGSFRAPRMPAPIMIIPRSTRGAWVPFVEKYIPDDRQ